jgi:ATP-binding cassette subfamily B protein
VKIDDIDIKEMDPQFLRSLISVVEQRPLLFRGTIMDNIKYGSPDASDEEVHRVAKMANCDLFVERLPHKYHTLLGDNGAQLSGGQIQRLALARALLRYKDSKILLLDEVTSNLDSQSEALIQESIERISKESQKTIILIAHRISTAKFCDKIIVMDEGKIVEMGPYNELLGTEGGHFAQLAKNQHL